MTRKSSLHIEPPAFGDPVAPVHPSPEALRLLALRRSTSAEMLTTPGPDAATLASILEVAARVPDHRKIVPFRFIIMEGEARSRLGVTLAERFAALNPDADNDRLDIERRRFERAPVVITVVAAIKPDHKTPEWEQTLTNGAVCYNLLLSASAHGFAGNWLTDWCAYDSVALAALGVAPDEKIAGFVFIGTAKDEPRERQRPVMSEIVSWL